MCTASLCLNGNQQTCLHDGKTLKVVLFTEFCPLCDKQIITRQYFWAIKDWLHLCFLSFPNCPRHLVQFCENFSLTILLSLIALEPMQSHNYVQIIAIKPR